MNTCILWEIVDQIYSYIFLEYIKLSCSIVDLKPISWDKKWFHRQQREIPKDVIINVLIVLLKWENLKLLVSCLVTSHWKMNVCQMRLLWTIVWEKFYDFLVLFTYFIIRIDRLLFYFLQIFWYFPADLLMINQIVFISIFDFIHYNTYDFFMIMHPKLFGITKSWYLYIYWKTHAMIDICTAKTLHLIYRWNILFIHSMG